MSQSGTPRSFVHPFAPWYVRARPLLIAALALVLIGLALALPHPAPAAPTAQAGGSLVFVIDGYTLVTYNSATGERIGLVYDAAAAVENGRISSVITGPDGDVYAAMGAYNPDDNTERTWILRFDGSTGQPLGALVALPPDYDVILSLAASADGYLYAQQYNSIARFRLSDGANLGVLVDNLGSPYPAPGVPPRLNIAQLEIGPDGQLHGLGNYSEDALCCAQDLIARFDRTTGAYTGAVLLPQTILHFTFTYGPDGTLYTADYSRSLSPTDPPGRIYRFSPDGTPLGILTDLAPGVGHLEFGPDGLLYARAYRGLFEGPGEDLLLRFDPQSGALLGEYVLKADTACCVSRQSFAFGRALPQGGEVAPVRRAAVGLGQRSTPSFQASRGELVTLTLAATNRGDGSASEATIDLPIDPARIQLLDAQFSRAGAWVSARRDDGVTIQTGRLGSGGDTVTATLRLQVRADAPDGPLFPSRPTLRWRDAATGGSSAANLLAVVAAGQSLDAPTLPLAIDPPSAESGVARNVSAGWLTPGEPVALWYDRPDGTSVALGRVTATADGTISYQLTAAGLTPGRYQLVAQGVSSGVTLAGAFEVWQ